MLCGELCPRLLPSLSLPFVTFVTREGGAGGCMKTGQWVVSDLGVEVEEGVDAEAELGFDLLSAALEDVHGDAAGVAVFEFDGCIVDGGEFVRG